MNPVLRNIIAVVVGVLVGGALNMGIIMISGSVIPLPEGINPESMESLKENMHLMKPINFLMPFLAHALGTFVGAMIATFIAASRKMTMAMIVGGFFFLGGVANIFMLPGPMWFNAVDVILAYFPMAWLGWKLTSGISEK